MKIEERKNTPPAGLFETDSGLFAGYFAIGATEKHRGFVIIDAKHSLFECGIDGLSKKSIHLVVPGNKLSCGYVSSRIAYTGGIDKKHWFFAFDCGYDPMNEQTKWFNIRGKDFVPINCEMFMHAACNDLAIQLKQHDGGLIEGAYTSPNGVKTTFLYEFNNKPIFPSDGDSEYMKTRGGLWPLCLLLLIPIVIVTVVYGLALLGVLK